MKDKRFSKTLFLFIIIALLIPFSLSAQENNPKQVIQIMSDQFENEVLSHQDDIKKNPEIADKLINKHLIPNVNFLLMSRYVLGKNWKKASATEKDEFVWLFKALLIRFYSKAFTEYLKKYQIKKGMISFLPYREKKGSKYAKVNIEIKIKPNAPKVKVKYTLYKSKTKGWKIYDISIEGISLVTSYRSSFKEIIAKEKISGLIEHLKKKVASMDHHHSSS